MPPASPRMAEPPRLLREGIPRSVAVWLFACLTALLAVLLWVGVRDVAPPDPGPLVAVRSDAGPQGLRIAHIAGERVAVEDAVLFVTVGERTQILPLAEVAPGLGPTWDAGEQVCIVGAQPDCLHAQAVSAQVRVVVEGRLLHEARVGLPAPATAGLPLPTGLPTALPTLAPTTAPTTLPTAPTLR